MVFLSNRLWLIALVLCTLVLALQDCHAQEDEPPAWSARELLERVERQHWGEGLRRIEYVARYLQDGVPAVANCRLERHPERKLALWRIDRIDPSENGLTHVYLRNADGVFHLVRKSPTGPWILREHGYRKPDADGGALPRLPDPGEFIDREFQLLGRLPHSLMLGKTIKTLVDDFDHAYSDSSEAMPTIIGELQSGKSPPHGIESFELMIDPENDSIQTFEFVTKHSVKAKGLLRPLPNIRAGDTVGFHWMQTTTSETLPLSNSEIQITGIEKEVRDVDVSEFFLPYYGLAMPDTEEGAETERK